MQRIISPDGVCFIFSIVPFLFLLPCLAANYKALTDSHLKDNPKNVPYVLETSAVYLCLVMAKTKPFGQNTRITLYVLQKDNANASQ